MKLPEKIEDVVNQFAKLSGVGPKTALRQTLMLTRWSAEELKEFSSALENLGQLKHCIKCGLFCNDEHCRICNDERRAESGILCVVESISDCMAIENSEQFNGRFHILGGTLNPLMGIGPAELKIDDLVKRVQEDKIRSVILAINPSVEGDATCSYIKQELSEFTIVERIGFGIPIGGSLEYLDPLTINQALENRKRME